MKLSRKITIGTLSAVAIAAPAVLAISCGTDSGPKIDVEFSWDNVTVVFGGDEGRGRAEIKGKEIDGLTYELSKNHHLSEGDKVILTVKADESHTVNGESSLTKEYTVNSLNPALPIKNINITKNQLDVRFDGIDGSGKAVVQTLNPGLSYEMSDDSLSNNEDVTIKVIAKPGYSVNYQEEVSFTYRVTGLPTTPQTQDTNINLNVNNAIVGEFSGWNGRGTFNWDILENETYYTINDPEFNGAVNGQLKNGDRATLSITPKPGYTINGSARTVSASFEVQGLQDIPTQDLVLTNDDFFIEYYWSGDKVETQIKCTTWFVDITPNWPTNGITEGSTFTLDVTPDFGFTINGKTSDQFTFTATGIPPKPLPLVKTVTRDSFGIAFPGEDGNRSATIVKKPEGATVTLDKSSGLSTGDIVTLTATWIDASDVSQTGTFQYMVTPPSLYDMIEDNEPVTYYWDANKSHTWLDSLYVRDAQFGIFFPKPFAQMTPWEFGMYLVNMYNHAGSGIMHLTMEFNGHTDTVDVDFKAPLLELISTFSRAEITPLTPRFDSGILGRASTMDPSTLVSLISSAPQLLGMVVDYGYDMFFPSLDGNHGPITENIMPELMSLASRILGGESRVMNEMFPVIAPFPDETIAAFGNLAAIFTEMTKGFADSEVAHEWANAQTQKEIDELGTRDHCTMANTYIRLVMLQGIGEI